MLKLAILFAKHMYPTCTRIVLTDMSGYHDQEVGNVDLPIRDMFLYKQTWYQRHLSDLNLKPCSKKGKSIVKEYLEILDTKPSKSDRKELGFDSVSETVYDAIQLLHASGKPKLYPTIIKTIQQYNLTTLIGLDWVGNLKNDDLFPGLVLDKTSIKKPETLKAQWGGQRITDQHLFNMVM